MWMGGGGGGGVPERGLRLPPVNRDMSVPERVVKWEVRLLVWWWNRGRVALSHAWSTCDR